jgi:CBS domain containing-hemolysin-like protein
MTLLLAFFFLSILFSFMCSVWEAVLLSVTPTFIHRLKADGNSAGRTLEKFKQDIDRPLSAILTLNTIAHTAGAIGVGVQASKIFGGYRLGGSSLSLSIETIVAVLMTLAILVFSEIIPKTIGANNWKALAPFTARSIKILLIVLGPFVFMSQLITRALKKNKEESVLSRLDFQVMVQSAEKSGELRDSEFQIINNLLGFEKLSSEDIMTPRNVVMMADEKQTLREFYDTYKNRMTFSRIPLYSDSRDHITGILLKDLLLQKLIEGEGERPLSDIRRDVGMVSDVATLPVLFNQMVQQNQHMNIVIDEFGVLRGIVTMEDLIETLFGQEIVDEMDSVSDLQEFARKKWKERAKKLGIMEMREDDSDTHSPKSEQREKDKKKAKEKAAADADAEDDED